MTKDTSKDVTRYDETWEGMGHSIDGDYVYYTDYAALSAQLEASQNEDVVCGELYREAVRQCDKLRHQHSVAHAKGKAEGLREAAGVCEAQKVSFLSPEYATHQPLSSYSERFACGVCAAAILALIPATTGGRDVDMASD